MLSTPTTAIPTATSVLLLNNEVNMMPTDGPTVDVANVPVAAAALGVPEPPAASPDDGAVPHEATAGNLPLHDPVARDAREGMLAILVGSSGPPSVGLECRASQPLPDVKGMLKELADDDSTTDEAMHTAIEEALSYPKRVGASTFWIATGDSLPSQSNDKIIKSLFRDNRVATWSALLSKFVQVNKDRGGDVVVTVTDETTRLGMLGQTVHILGDSYTVATPSSAHRTPGPKQHDELQDLYYMDIVGTRYDFDSQALHNALRSLKSRPVFVCYKMTYTSVHQTSTVHPNIWRVYFNQPAMPSVLLVQGHPVVEGFERPKHPLKLKRTPMIRKCTWLSENMYDSLSLVNVSPRVVTMPHNIPVLSYSMDIQLPSSREVNGRVGCRRMRIKSDCMDWHPDSLTMKELMRELQHLDNTCDPTQTQNALITAANQPQQDIPPVLEHARVDSLWQWICADPDKANV
ncbi:hypothetical protein DYB32_010577, partial [Aphanomyces invadans]